MLGNFEHNGNPEIADLVAGYLDAPVGNYVEAPRIPGNNECTLDELTTPESIRRLSLVEHVDPTTEMAIIDKKFPHALREIMWMHIGETAARTLSEYLDLDPTRRMAVELFSSIASLARYSEGMGHDVAVSWSSDPDTKHRPSIQGEKRLHFHLVSRDEEDIEQINAVTGPIAGLNIVDRRRIAEEFSFVASQSVRGVFTAEPVGGVILDDIHPCFLSMRVGDWEDLAKENTIAKIEALISFVEDQYSSVVEALGGEDEEGRIKIADNLDLIEFASEKIGSPDSVAVQLLAGYLESCRQFSQYDSDRHARIRNKHLRTVTTVSSGFAFSGNFSKYNGILYFNLRPCKYSDLGGAGCSVIDGMPVRVRKGHTDATRDQLAQRRQYVNDAVELLAS